MAKAKIRKEGTQAEKGKEKKVKRASGDTESSHPLYSNPTPAHHPPPPDPPPMLSVLYAVVGNTAVCVVAVVGIAEPLSLMFDSTASHTPPSLQRILTTMTTMTTDPLNQKHLVPA